MAIPLSSHLISRRPRRRIFCQALLPGHLELRGRETEKKKNLTCAYTEIDAAALCGRVIEKIKKTETQQPRFQQINPTEYLDRREMGPFHIPLTGLLGFSEHYLLTILGQ